MKAGWLPRIASVVFAGLMIFNFIFVWQANTDLIDGRPVLFMDEQIIFDNVKRIIHSADGEFLWNVMDGDDHRYGRILYFLSAAASWIPASAYEDPGMIVSVRVFLAVLLNASYALLLWTFVSSWAFRCFGLAMILTLPHAPYYSTMPKPEPVALFFLALFLLMQVRQGWRFTWRYFLLGLAFGAKISMLPAVMVVSAVSALMTWKLETNLNAFFRKFGTALVSFAIGLVVAVPILAKGEFAKYVTHTFKNTTHGSDDQSVNFGSWISLVNLEMFGGDNLIAVLIIASAGLLLALFFRDLKPKALFEPESVKAVLPLVLGCALMLPIALFVKRLWGLYLHLGMTLLVVGLVAISEHLWKAKGARKWTSVTVLCLAVTTAVNFALVRGPQTLQLYRDLATRTSTPQHQQQLAVYRVVNEFLENLGQKAEHRLKVAMSPALFNPESTSKFEIINFWGPFLRWQDKWDVVVATRLDFGDPRSSLPAPTAASFPDFKVAREAFLDHVHSDGRCKLHPCYIPCQEIGVAQVFVSGEVAQRLSLEEKCRQMASHFREM